MKIVRAIGPLLFASALACAHIAYKFTATGPSATARGPGCELEIISTVPQRPFRELGVIEDTGTVSAYTLSDFRNAAHDMACQAGADAVVVQINGQGAYVKATAIKYTTAPAGQPAP